MLQAFFRSNINQPFFQYLKSIGKADFICKMLSRTLAVVPLARKTLSLNVPAVTAMARRFDHGPPANYRFPTMDDMPVPCGSWQENYENNQRKYNIHLLFGVGFFIITLSVGILSGSFDLYMTTPDKPASGSAN